VIVWVDGAFGAGKTTLAGELVRRLPGALLLDPELVGHILRTWVPDEDTGDFQDVPLWRDLVTATVLGTRRRYPDRPLVIPMSVLDARYRDELFVPIRVTGEDLLHVFLDLPVELLRRRIDADRAEAGARSFRLRNAERAAVTVAALPADSLALRSDLHSPAELADLVMAALANGPSQGHPGPPTQLSPPLDIRVRPPLDDAAVSALHARAFGHPYAEAPPWRDRLAQHSLTWIGAFSGNALVGFVNAAWDGGQHAFVLDTVVDPDHQRHGIGTALVRALAEQAAAAGCAWLHVDCEPHATAFYRDSCGFRATDAGLLRLR